MARTIRVAVVDDHAMFREGVVEMIGTLEDVEVVVQGASSADAVEIARAGNADVILLDLDMPSGDGLTLGGVSAAEAIRELDPAIGIVIVTMHEDPILVRRLLQIGVRGFLSKTAGRSELHAALKSATHRGAGLVTVTLTDAAATVLSNHAQASQALLTKRELDVLNLLAGTGHSNQELAAELHVAPATVKRHLATIYDKLEVNSRIQAVRKATMLGLISDKENGLHRKV